MKPLTGILAVAGTSLFGVVAVLAAMHFRDSSEVPKWAPPSPSYAYAPAMAGLAAEPPAVAPRAVVPPVQPAPQPAIRQLAVAPPPPPPAPIAAPPAPPPLAVAPPPPAATNPEDLDEDDPVQQAAEAEKRRVLEANKLRALDLRSKRMMQHPRFTPQRAAE